jgi:hypothetical protein
LNCYSHEKSGSRQTRKSVPRLLPSTQQMCASINCITTCYKHNLARVTQGHVQARQKTKFDTKVFGNTHNERDWVWITNPEKTSTNTGIHPVVTIDRVKPFYYSDAHFPQGETTDAPDGNVRPVTELGNTVTRSESPPEATSVQLIPLGTKDVRAGRHMGETVFSPHRRDKP